MTQNANNLCWLDMEMTGLDPERERIIEVAMIITDPDLNVLAQSEVYVVHQSNELLDGMDEWNTATHGRTGLTQRVRESQLTEAEVEQKLLDFIAQWIPEKATPMCGNSARCQRRGETRFASGFGRYSRKHRGNALLPRKLLETARGRLKTQNGRLGGNTSPAAESSFPRMRESSLRNFGSL